MIGTIPKFFDSPYFVDDEDNWHLLPGAPEEVVKEFNEYMGITDSDNKPVKKSLTEEIQGILKDFSK